MVKRSPSQLHLVIPGLLGPVPDSAAEAWRADVPALESFLGRANAGEVGVAGFDATLFHLFGYSADGNKGLPVAPLCRLGDGGEPDDACWLCADPVHLSLQGDGLYLLEAASLDLSRSDADALSHLFNEHFREEGWQLEAPTPERWYLKLHTTPELTVKPVREVVGRNIDRFLPSGADAPTWHAVMNEVQMLFHSSRVNSGREESGRLTVSGLWFSGGGLLPRELNSPYANVAANDPLARGMALCAGMTPSATGGEWETAGGDSLVVEEGAVRPLVYADPQTWSEALAALDRRLKHAVDALRRKELALVRLYPCNGRVYSLDRAGLRRFWKRPAALREFIKAAPAAV